MQPKVKIALTVFSFVALVLTGLAAAEQVPTKKPSNGESLFSPSIISLSPKVVGNKGAKQDRVLPHSAPMPKDTFIKDFPTMVE